MPIDPNKVQWDDEIDLNAVQWDSAPQAAAPREYTPLQTFNRTGGAFVSGVADALNTGLNMAGVFSDERAAENMARIDDVRSDHPIAAVGGEVAALAVPASKLAKLPRVAQYLGNAGLGAAVGASRGVREGETRIGNAALGGALGAAGQGIAHGLAASGKAAAQAVSPELRALARKAESMGIPLTPAQLSDSSFVKRLAMMTDRMPFSGATGRAEAQQTAGNRQLASLLGQKADTVDSGVMARAADDIGAKFDQVMAGGMKYGRDFLRGVADVKKDAQLLDDSAVRVANNIADRIRRSASGGQMSGRTVQSLDRQLRVAASGKGDGAQVAGQLRELLHDTFEKSAPPAVKQTWDTARRQWATLKTLEPVVARNTEGGIPLQQLQGAINSNQRGRILRSRGRDGDLGVLATIGQRLKSPSTSGTAENAQAAGLGAGLVTSPLATLLTLGAGPIGSRVLASGSLARLLLSEGRGQGRQLVAPYARAVVGATPTVADAKRTKDSRKRP